MNSFTGTFPKDTNANVIQLSELKIIKYQKEDPFTFKYKYSYSQENFNAIVVEQIRNEQDKNNIKLDEAYQKKLTNERRMIRCS